MNLAKARTGRRGAFTSSDVLQLQPSIPFEIPDYLQELIAEWDGPWQDKAIEDLYRPPTPPHLRRTQTPPPTPPTSAGNRLESSADLYSKRIGSEEAETEAKAIEDHVLAGSCRFANATSPQPLIRQKRLSTAPGRASPALPVAATAAVDAATGAIWRPSEAPPKEPMLEMIPRHYPSDAMHFRRPHLMAMCQVRPASACPAWEKVPKGGLSVRHELAVYVCSEPSDGKLEDQPLAHCQPLGRSSKISLGRSSDAPLSVTPSTEAPTPSPDPDISSRPPTPHCNLWVQGPDRYSIASDDNEDGRSSTTSVAASTEATVQPRRRSSSRIEASPPRTTRVVIQTPAETPAAKEALRNDEDYKELLEKNEEKNQRFRARRVEDAEREEKKMKLNESRQVVLPVPSYASRTSELQRLSSLESNSSEPIATASLKKRYVRMDSIDSDDSESPKKPEPEPRGAATARMANTPWAELLPRASAVADSGPSSVATSWALRLSKAPALKDVPQALRPRVQSARGCRSPSAGSGGAIGIPRSSSRPLPEKQRNARPLTASGASSAANTMRARQSAAAALIRPRGLASPCGDRPSTVNTSENCRPSSCQPTTGR